MNTKIDSIINGIYEARVEAEKRNIRANAVMINDSLCYAKLCAIAGDVHPMVCGLRAFYTSELPDEMLFSVVEACNIPLTKDAKIERLELENQELRDKLKKVAEFAMGGECDA